LARAKKFPSSHCTGYTSSSSRGLNLDGMSMLIRSYGVGFWFMSSAIWDRISVDFEHQGAAKSWGYCSSNTDSCLRRRVPPVEYIVWSLRNYS
jgi:hypothetical protein